jgi:hypothetical protein
MDILKWLDRVFTSAFDIFFGLLIFAAAVGGAIIAWQILPAFEVSTLVQIGGTLAAFLISGAIAWLILQIMKIFA